MRDRERGGGGRGVKEREGERRRAKESDRETGTGTRARALVVQPYFRVTVALPSGLDRLCATRCILPTPGRTGASHTAAFIFGWRAE